MELKQSEFGKYELVNLLGKSELGETWRATAGKSHNQVVVKLVAGAGGGPSSTELFSRAAPAVDRQQYSGLVPVLDYGVADDYFFVVTPYYAGGSLQTRQHQNPLSRGQMVEVFQNILTGLQAAHSQNIVHGNLKPSNIVLDDSGRAAITDFGLSQTFQAKIEAALRQSHMVAGSPEYKAPEQFTAQAEPRSDLYSAGIILYWLLTGRVPFTGTSSRQVGVRHAKEPLTVRGLNVPRSLVRFLLKVLEKQPENRYATATEMQVAFRESVAAFTPEDYQSAPAPAMIQPQVSAPPEATRPFRVVSSPEAAPPPLPKSPAVYADPVWPEQSTISFAAIPNKPTATPGPESQSPAGTGEPPVTPPAAPETGKIQDQPGAPPVVSEQTARFEPIPVRQKESVSQAASGSVEVNPNGSKYSARPNGKSNNGHKILPARAAPAATAPAFQPAPPEVKTTLADAPAVPFKVPAPVSSNPPPAPAEAERPLIPAIPADPPFAGATRRAAPSRQPEVAQTVPPEKVSFATGANRQGQAGRLPVWLIPFLGGVGVTLALVVILFVFLSGSSKNPAPISAVTATGTTGATTTTAAATSAVSTTSAAGTSAAAGNPSAATLTTVATSPATPGATTQTGTTAASTTAATTAPGNTVAGVSTAPGTTVVAPAPGTTSAQTATGNPAPASRVALSGHTGPVNTVSWSKDGRYYATGSDDKTIKIWEAATNRVVITLEDKSKPVSDRILTTVWSADGQYVVSGAADKTVRIHWAVPAGEMFKAAAGQVLIEASEGVVPEAVAIAPDGALVPYPAAGSLLTWNFITDNYGPELKLNAPNTRVTALAFSPDSKFLAVGLSNNQVQIWNMAIPRLQATIQPQPGEDNPVTALAWTPSGKQLAVGRQKSLAVHQVDAASGAVAGVAVNQSVTAPVSVVAISDDGKRLAAGTRNGEVFIFSLENNQRLHQFSSGAGPVAGLHWSGNNQQIEVASGGNQPALAVYRL